MGLDLIRNANDTHNYLVVNRFFTLRFRIDRDKTRLGTNNDNDNTLIWTRVIRSFRATK